jgi:ATP adenylyltransferase
MADNLWAPWRMEYILGDKSGACVFCEEAAGASPKRVLCVQPHAFVILNKYPFAAGHLLVVPRRHVSDLAELTGDEADALFRLLRASVARLQAAVSPQGVNVGFNLGKAAGAGIAEHLHAHVVPRWNGDTNFMPALAAVRVMPEHLDATFERLAPHFADLASRADG